MSDYRAAVGDVLNHAVERAEWVAGMNARAWAAYDVAEAALEAFLRGGNPTEAMRAIINSAKAREAHPLTLRLMAAERYAIEEAIRGALRPDAVAA